VAGLTWRDTEKIAAGLVSRYPDTNPLGVTSEELRELVVKLEEFGDDPAAGSPSTLEAIQAAWYDLYES
jgi:FeS assembly protein IscX